MYKIFFFNPANIDQKIYIGTENSSLNEALHEASLYKKKNPALHLFIEDVTNNLEFEA